MGTRLPTDRWKQYTSNEYLRAFPKRAHIHRYMYGNPGMVEKCNLGNGLAFPSNPPGKAGTQGRMPRFLWTARFPFPRSQARQCGRAR